jgi:copper chaperone CopZ
MKRLVYLLLGALFIISCNSGTNDSKNNESKPPEYITTTISVEGMTCSGCENTVKTSLLEMNGVNAVAASHEKKIVKVKYDMNLTDLDAISKKIGDKGYQVKGEIKDKPEEINSGEAQN